jgi:signal transduction histidine kinase
VPQLEGRFFTDASPAVRLRIISCSSVFPGRDSVRINNAIKYSPDGGTVELSISSDGDHAVVRVRDYGIGISSEALPRIFEASYRAREAATCAPGLGLGLSIASQVIARHGGTIEAAPVEGRGTIVTVRLPLAPVQRQEDAGAAAAQPVSI